MGVKVLLFDTINTPNVVKIFIGHDWYSFYCRKSNTITRIPIQKILKWKDISVLTSEISLPLLKLIFSGLLSQSYACKRLASMKAGSDTIHSREIENHT